MDVDLTQSERPANGLTSRAVDATNPFLAGECVLKKCCKKYKKGKRCKRCPD